MTEIPDFLEWSVQPMKRSAAKTVILLIFLIIVGVMVYFWFYSLWISVLSVLLVGLAVRQYFVVTRYRLDQETVEVVTPFSRVTKRWTDFKSFYPDRNGVLLSPFPTKSWLENYRGIYLLFENNQSEVVEFIRQKITPRPEQSVQGSSDADKSA